MERGYKRALSMLLIIILTAVLAYAISPYINAFFGAFILYVIFRPLYIFLTATMGMRASLAAVTVIIVTVMIVLIPIYILLTIVILEIQDLLAGIGGITDLASIVETNSLLAMQLIRDILPPAINLQERITGLAVSAAGLLSTVLIGAVRDAGKRFLEFSIMYFMLFYLLVGGSSEFVRSLRSAVPFNEENTRELLSRFDSVVKTILISSGVIAVIQGMLLTVTFLLFGLEGAFLWGFMTFILSFIPALGTPIIWAPAVLIQLLQQDYTSAAGVFIGGMIVSSVDNLMRPAINKKVGQLHPLVSLIGVVIGLNLFGLMGIIIGPLLLSYTILTARMFHDEYL
jgi:predicted PurR-regulated permease PerM